MIYLINSTRCSIISPPEGLLLLVVLYQLVKAAALLFLFFIPAVTGTVWFVSLLSKLPGLKSRWLILFQLNIFTLSLPCRIL